MAGRRRSDRALRDKLRAPGCPGGASREKRRRFWAFIAEGLSSEDAAMKVEVSQPVGSRWFRVSGGLAPSHLARSSKPLSERYLSFAEREAIALLRAQGAGVRKVARRLGRAASTISRELRRNAATRGGNLDYRATRHSGTRSARRVDQSLRSWRRMRHCGPMCRSVSPASSLARVGRGERAVPWKGRRHGPRQHRRWARAWSPQQIAARLRLDDPDD